MRGVCLIFVLLASLGPGLACRRLPPEKPMKTSLETLCRDSVAGMHTLTAGLKLSPDLQRMNAFKGEFDPNRYFKVLTRLRVHEGSTLDYVYHYDGMGGYPMLYVRRLDEKPLRTAAEYRAAKPATYLSGIEVDDAPEGYLQLAILSVMGGQYYLFWHAGYNDVRVVCGQESIDEIIRERGDSDRGFNSAGWQERARSIPDPAPTARLEPDRAIVGLLTFTKWGGFLRNTYSIRRSFPHEITVQRETVVEYRCGIVF
jgi:hypothetical protein